MDLKVNPVLLPKLNNCIVIMQRFDGSVNFNRNWVKYRNGFGNIRRGEFWLGNEKVHRLTSQIGVVYSLRIEVFIFSKLSSHYNVKCGFRSSVLGQNGSGQKGTGKMVWTNWYTGKMVLDKMVRTKWHG